MDEQKVDRLAAAIDSIVLEGKEPDVDPDLGPFVSLAMNLQAAMPPIEASPAFQRDLRAHLLTPRLPWWKLLARKVVGGVAPDPAPSFVGGVAPDPAVSLGKRPARLPLRPLYAFAALALAIAVGVLATRSNPEQSQTIQAQPVAPAVVPDSPSLAASAQTLLAPGISGSTVAVGAEFQLPPLSETSPLVMLGGLGGGGLGGAEGEVPRPEMRFELATSLPALPGEVSVYRYKAPSADIEKLRRLATSLGFDPRAIQPMVDAPDAYLVSDPKLGSVDMPGAGAPVTYRAVIGKEMPSDVSATLPNSEDAALIATTWLAKNDLLPPDLGSPQLSRPYDKATFEEVTFRPVEPVNIVGEFPSVKVGVDGGAKVISASVLWPEVDSILALPARSADSAWQMLVSGKGQLHFDGEQGRPDFHGTIRITSAKAGYTMTFALDGRPYLQPVVVFSGESIMDGDPERHPFRAEVPAVADSALPKEDVAYVFTGQLPPTRAEAAVLERTPAPPFTREQVLELGTKLGLSGEPRAIPGPPGSGSNWEMGDPNGTWMLRVAGDLGPNSWMETWSYSLLRYEPPSNQASLNPPDAEQAIGIATDFLRSHGLYTPDLAPGRIQLTGLGASAVTVLFPSMADGIPVVEPAGIAVVLDARGDVVSIISNQHPMRGVRTDRILTPSEALEAVKGGRGTIRVPSLPGRTIYSQHAEVEEVELVYQLRAPEIGNQPPAEHPVMRYEPYYLFTGTVEVGESHKRLPFTTTLLAWAPQS